MYLGRSHCGSSLGLADHERLLLESVSLVLSGTRGTKVSM